MDFSKIKTYPIRSRKSKESVKNFAKVSRGKSFKSFYDSLPNNLSANDLKNLVLDMKKARRKKRQIIWMIGGHVVKTGLAPLIIDLMKKGFVTHVAMNGAGSIHDFEIAMIGKTSEDVGEAIEDGSFGMSRETGEGINFAIQDGLKNGLGYGESVGKAISDKKFEYRDYSIVYNCFRNKIPATVHVSVGCDIIHQQPSCDGAALGEASYIDFKKIAKSISKLDGGVVLNVGSAVVLPEVFLKAITVARNLKHKVRDFSAANFDMIRQYRPMQNVVERPTKSGGRGYNFIGQHEIMIPLLAKAISGC
ncbi:MAG: hypothetical protein ACD_63C00024G0008 [uncultured bacterium]|nr:MAG: hypothetical protein ACD_63C00024G0008 [uncultured bacterium]